MVGTVPPQVGSTNTASETSTVFDTTTGSVFDTTTGSFAASTTSTIGPVMDSLVETSRFYINVSNLMLLSSMGSIRYQVSMIGQDIDIR